MRIMNSVGNESTPDPPYARFVSNVADLADPVWRPLRTEAIQLLQLNPGDRVLDVGCGTGIGFPYLLSAVGTTGEVVGVEISPYMTKRALDNIFRYLKADARVVTFGAKQLHTRLVNPLFRLASKKLLPASAPIDYQPWRILEERLEHVSAEERVAGIMYLVWGSNPLRPTKD